MELFKTEHSNNKRDGKLDKVLLKCDDPNYYELTDYLSNSNIEQSLILKALYESKTNVVLKFGILESIEKEYKISEELLELPGFIKYFCMIKCNDNIKNIINIINNQKKISNYKICHFGNNPIGILVMKEYVLGSVENYDWNKNNFHILKNVIKQVIFSILLAFDTKCFIHGDLHSGNVLLKTKRNNSINYNEKKILQIEVFEVIIMDFEKSKIKQNNNITDLMRNIIKFINSIVDSNNMRMNLNYDRNKLFSLKSIFNTNTNTNINYYDQIEKIIDDMYIYI